jgi:anti-sigma factor RsiW
LGPSHQIDVALARDEVATVRLRTRRDDHRWSQGHLSHYLEGELNTRARRRLERHAADCADCSRGLRALKTLLRLLARIDEGDQLRAPERIFDRVRSDAAASRARDPRGGE